MKIHLLSDDILLPELLAVLNQLRVDYDANALMQQVQLQRSEGYQLAYAELDGEIVAVAGFVVGHKLAWGKYIYVDDLVTAEAVRGQGLGEQLIAWLKQHGRELGCQQLHLDSGVQRFPAHRFYLNQGFNIASHHFSVTDLSC